VVVFFGLGNVVAPFIRYRFDDLTALNEQLAQLLDLSLARPAKLHVLPVAAERTQVVSPLLGLKAPVRPLPKVDLSLDTVLYRVGHAAERTAPELTSRVDVLIHTVHTMRCREEVPVSKVIVPFSVTNDRPAPFPVEVAVVANITTVRVKPTALVAHDPAKRSRPRTAFVDAVESILPVSPDPLTLTHRVIEHYVTVISALRSIVVHDDPTSKPPVFLSNPSHRSTL
jgi:hypothetical protein